MSLAKWQNGWIQRKKKHDQTNRGGQRDNTICKAMLRKLRMLKADLKASQEESVLMQKVLGFENEDILRA